MKRIAVLVETTFGFAHQIMAGITRGWAIHEDWELLLYQQGYPDPVLLRTWEVHGILGLFSDRKPVDPYLDLGVPIVNTSASVLPKPVVTVNTDQDAVGREAGKLLRGLGLSSFGFVGFPKAVSSRGRLTGFRAGLGPDAPPPSIHWLQGAMVQWPDLLAEWLGKLVKPAGVFVASDTEARMLLSVCRRAGIHVPEDVAIVGANNEEAICTTCRPTLSSVPTSLVQVGERAVEVLDRLMRRDRLGTFRIEIRPGPAVRRGSTARSVAFNDPVVARGVRFIREELDRGIGVAEVARHCGVSRRTLEYHFEAVFGHTPADEIQQARLQRAKELLSQTNLRLEDIAVRVGFNSAQYLATFFRKQTGHPPSTYRLTSVAGDIPGSVPGMRTRLRPTPARGGRGR